jgi:hypothetical protein
MAARVDLKSQAAALRLRGKAPDLAADHSWKTTLMLPTARKRSKARRPLRIGVSSFISILIIPGIGTKGYPSFKFLKIGAFHFLEGAADENAGTWIDWGFLESFFCLFYAVSASPSVLKSRSISRQPSLLFR